jgi:hypothetical protein
MNSFLAHLGKTLKRKNSLLNMAIDGSFKQNNSSFHGKFTKIIPQLENSCLIGLVFPYAFQGMSLMEFWKAIEKLPDNYIPSGPEIIMLLTIHSDFFLKSEYEINLPGIIWGGAPSSFCFKTDPVKKAMTFEGKISCINSTVFKHPVCHPITVILEN